jgi:hypothetical protein
MNKAEQHELIRERARAALRNLYHNATINYPRDLHGRSEDYAQQWIEDAAQFEVEYIADGGPYGRNYRATLAAPCNAGRYKSERARAYYVAKGMRDMREESAGHAWQNITDFGKLYSWGRGGRTLAPENLIEQRGGGAFSIREDYADEMPISSVVDLIRIVESFNRYVESWCAGVPEMWDEHCKELAAEERAEKRRLRQAARDAKRTAMLAKCFC